MPGSYNITVDRIKERLAERRLVHLTGASSGAVSDALIESAIGRAERELHRYSSVYYATPLRTEGGQVPEGIEELLEGSSIWHLTTLAPEFLGENADEGKFWEKRRGEITTYYQQIAGVKGHERLPIADALPRASVSTAPRGGRARIKSDAPRFPLDKMGRFFK